PGVLVKLQGSRIEAQISSQFIAEGSSSNPIVFTSIKDDQYGSGGTFDTNGDAAATSAAPGDGGGLVFDAAAAASLDHVKVLYGGGLVPVEGRLVPFNAIEDQQADLRITNSLLQHNAGGAAVPGDDRNGRGTNADAVIFVRGAQPIIVGNIIRDNSASNTGPVISINANAMVSTAAGDYGRSTGSIDRFTQFDDNRGPLVR